MASWSLWGRRKRRGSEPTSRAQEVAPPWPPPQGSLSLVGGASASLLLPHDLHPTCRQSYFYHHHEALLPGEKAGGPEVTQGV